MPLGGMRNLDRELITTPHYSLHSCLYGSLVLPLRLGHESQEL